jgi:hypothetical protein
LEGLVVRREEEGVGEEKRREKEEENVFQQERERIREEMRYFWVKPNKYPFHVKLPSCPCLKRVKNDSDTFPVKS